MKTISQYVLELLPKSWRAQADISRYEDRPNGDCGFEIEFNCPNYTQLESIKTQIIELGQSFGSLISSFDVYIRKESNTNRRNTTLRVRYKLPFTPDRWTHSRHTGIIWYVNLCVETKSILLEYFLSEDGANEIPEYYQLCVLALFEIYIAPHYTVSYHRTRITTNCYFEVNNSFGIDRFIVAAIK